MTGDKIILLVSLLIGVLTQSLWGYAKELWDIQIFYIGMALTFVGYSFVIHRLMKSILSEIVLLATVNNLIDELFFDPTKLEINEYVLFFLAITIILYNAKRRSA